MTVSTTSSVITVAGNAVTTSFSVPFIMDSAADITVSSIASNGAITILTPSQYTLIINPPSPNQIWGIGGTVVYPTSGTPIPSGTYLQIQRTLPLTQTTSIQNQGNVYPQVTEIALDQLCMEIQQVAARTTQFRGIWATGVIYNVGDIVQDGTGGNDTLNYYICANSNTSTTWAADLAAGDWALSVLATVPTTNQMITLSGAVSGAGTTSITTGFPANSINYASLTKLPAHSVLGNPSASSGNVTSVSSASLASSMSLFYTIHSQSFISSGTYNPSAGMLYCIAEVWGGGGGGGGVNTANPTVAGGGGAGGYAKKTISASAIGGSQTITIASGGTGGSNIGGTGGTGGTTSLGAIISASGGFGGVGNTSTNASANGGLGGVGSSGDVNITGVAGGASVGNLPVAAMVTGYGGNTTLGGGAPSRTNYVGIGMAATANTGSGGGGAGGSGSGAVGGSGASGFCIITEYCSQ